jgi:hypothetical protein
VNSESFSRLGMAALYLERGFAPEAMKQILADQARWNPRIAEVKKNKNPDHAQSEVGRVSNSPSNQIKPMLTKHHDHARSRRPRRARSAKMKLHVS